MKRLKFDGKTLSNPEMDALIANSLSDIRNDELVYPFLQNELKLSNKEAEVNIAALLDYQEDVHYCASCPGMERCDKLHPHFRLTLARDGSFIVRHYNPCEKMLSLASFKQRYLRCSFPESWCEDDLRNIEKSQSARKDAIMEMAKVIKGLSSNWLYLYGGAGSGKSYMLACLANMITKKNGPGAFANTSELLDELKELSIKNKEGFRDMMESLSQASILVLDDFGNEYKTEYTYVNVLFPLLNARDKSGLPTAFASDFPVESIGKMYKDKIGAVRAEQLTNLLKRRCKKGYDVTSINFHKED